VVPDLPSVVHRDDFMLHADIPQRLLHLPYTAAHHLGHPHADRGAPDQKVPGDRAYFYNRFITGAKLFIKPVLILFSLVVQPKPGPIQHQGACDNNDFCKLLRFIWWRRCILHWHHYSHEGVL
jgi:hypothetical protein